VGTCTGSRSLLLTGARPVKFTVFTRRKDMRECTARRDAPRRENRQNLAERPRSAAVNVSRSYPRRSVIRPQAPVARSEYPAGRHVTSRVREDMLAMVVVENAAAGRYNRLRIERPFLLGKGVGPEASTASRRSFFWHGAAFTPMMASGVQMSRRDTRPFQVRNAARAAAAALGSRARQDANTVASKQRSSAAPQRSASLHYAEMPISCQPDAPARRQTSEEHLDYLLIAYFRRKRPAQRQRPP